MKELLIAIATGLVDAKDEVRVEISEPNEEGVVTYTLYVAEDDKGRVIGKQGKIAKSIRTIMRSAATHLGEKIIVDIA